MTAEDLKILKSHIDQEIRIACVDGEVITVKLLVVSEEDEDIIFDLIKTNRPKLDQQPAYLLRFKHIFHVAPINDPRT
jgi:hypothetical protein